jgi:hypothetical protein
MKMEVRPTVVEEQQQAARREKCGEEKKHVQVMVTT